MIVTNKVKSIFKIGFTALVIGFSPKNSTAQKATQQTLQTKEYSKAELQKFVAASMDLQKVQMDAQQKMLTTLQNQDIDMMTFNQMAQVYQMGKEFGDKYTAEEKAAFEKAMKVVDALQAELESDVEAKLSVHNMTLQEYQTMAMAVQQNPELLEKVKSMMQGS